MRILRYIFVVLVCLTSVTTVFGAGSTLERIDIEIVLEESGTAEVKEMWYATVNGGSEAHRDLLNLNGSEVTGFGVKNELGKEYLVSSPWNSSDSRINKYTKCGTIEQVNGDTTLYWGLGDYGSRAYILTYNIKDFVKNCADGQFIYSGLVAPNTTPYPAKISVKITFPEDVQVSTGENIKVYGYQGRAEFVGNTLYLETADMTTNSSTYMTLLLKLNDRQFNCNTSFNKTFAEMVAITDENGGTQLDIQPITMQELIIKVAPFVILAILVILVITTIRIKKRLKNELGLPVKVIFDKNTVGIKTLNEIAPIRLTPQPDNLNETLYKIWSIGLQYKILPSEYSLIGAFLMKWVVNNNIKIKSIQNEALLHKDNEKLKKAAKQVNMTFNIEFIKEPDENLADDYEIELYDVLVKASLADYINKAQAKLNKLDKKKDEEKVARLQAFIDEMQSRIDNSDGEIELSDISLTTDAIEHWFRDNHTWISEWTGEILCVQADKQMRKGMLVKIKDSLLLRGYFTFVEYRAQQSLLEYANNIQGYKKFLGEQYSQTDNGSVDTDLIMAQLFGLSKALLNQLAKHEITSGYCANISTEDINIDTVAINKISLMIGQRVKASKAIEQRNILQKSLNKIQNRAKNTAKGNTTKK